MEDRDRLVTFKGSASSIQTRAEIAIIATMALVSVFLVGYWWLWLFLGLVIISLPPLILTHGMLSSRNWFALDDEKKCIVVPSKRSIPYDSLRLVTMTQIGDQILVSAQKGKLEKVSLVQNLSPGEKFRLIEELRRRFPENLLRQTNIAQWKISLALCLSPVVSGLLLFAVSYGMTLKDPDILEVPHEKTWDVAQAPADWGKEYSIDQVSFSVPPHFREAERKENRIIFESDEKRTVLRIFL